MFCTEKTCDHHGVREVVYLSKRKLDKEFGRSRGFRSWITNIQAKFKAGSVAELTVDATAGQRLLRQADAAVKGLRKGARAPVPALTERAHNGQWVQFAAPMSYTTIRNAAVFLDAGAQSEAHPTGDQARLLLHGSAVHLVDEGSVQHTTVDELSEQASEQFTAEGASPVPADCWASPINSFLDLIEWAAQEEAKSLESHGAMSFPHQVGAASLHEMVPLIERRLRLPYTAEWVGGYARVTAAPTGNSSIMFATPLYVERVAPPT